MSGRAIVQFGTSRFLQAHADLMLSEAREGGQDVGPLAIVETTGSAASRARIAALRTQPTFPVRLRGLVGGKTIDEERRVGGVAQAFSAREDGEALRAFFVEEAGYVLSNTGDRGFDLPPTPQPTQDGWTSFPELLTALLHERYRRGRGGLTLMPCELVERNGERLKATLMSAAEAGRLDAGFREWLDRECLFVNSLVDRIVSAPIEPIGAVAEPYALWAIECRPGFVAPCVHKDIQLVDDLDFIEKRKLFLLNLGHTLMAQRWLDDEGRSGDQTVRAMLADPELLTFLNGIMAEEVIPAFGDNRDEAAEYWRICLDRFANPFLDHRIADIAQNHAAKVERRAGGLMRWARQAGVPTPRLAALFPGAGR